MTCDGTRTTTALTCTLKFNKETNASVLINKHVSHSRTVSTSVACHGTSHIAYAPQSGASGVRIGDARAALRRGLW